MPLFRIDNDLMMRLDRAGLNNPRQIRLLKNLHRHYLLQIKITILRTFHWFITDCATHHNAITPDDEPVDSQLSFNVTGCRKLEELFLL